MDLLQDTCKLPIRSPGTHFHLSLSFSLYTPKSMCAPMALELTASPMRISILSPLAFAPVRHAHCSIQSSSTDEAKLPGETQDSVAKISWKDKCVLLQPGHTFRKSHASMEACRKEMEAAHPAGWFPHPTGICPPNPNLHSLNVFVAEKALEASTLGWQWAGQL